MAAGNDQLILSLAEFARMLGRANKTATILTVVIMVLTVVNAGLVIWQTMESRATARIQNDIALSDEFFDQPDNREILAAIDYGKPILTSAGGHMEKAQLDRYLDEFDGIESEYERHAITEADFCGDFAYFIQATFENVEIRKYMKSVRKTQPWVWHGLENDYSILSDSKDPNCH